MSSNAKRLLGLGLLCIAFGPALPACGPGGELAAVDIAFRRHGDGKSVHVVSAIHVDSEGAFWQATHAAGISASMAPDDGMALSFCQVVEGGSRGTGFTEFRALDLGAVRIEGDGREHPLERRDVASGEGSGFRGEIDVADLAYTAGQEYIVRADGSLQAPGFGVRVRAPDSFEVDSVGHVAPGAGTIPIPRNRDLRVRWSPGSEEGEMFIVLATPSQGLVCRVRDDGEFTIKKSHMTELTPMRGDLVLERYNEAVFDTGAASDGRARSGRGRYSVQRWFAFDLQ